MKPLGLAAVGCVLLAAGAATPAPVVEQPGKLIVWDEQARPGPAVYRIGGLTLTLSAQGKDVRAPVLAVRTADGRRAVVKGEAGLSIARAEFGVGRIDPSGPPDQVLFTTYTGGAHCCIVVRLVEIGPQGPKVVKMPSRNGGGLNAFPRDLDGDGRREFELYDDRFLYAFAPYAGSLAPPQIQAIESGAVKDVSAEPGFRPVFAAYAEKTRPDCEKHANGACAAYVAAAARASEADKAWPVMLAAYDKSDDWALPFACRAPVKADGVCPEAQRLTFATYPEALRWFLGEAGYMSRVYVEPLAAKGPSFSCAGALGAATKAVCASAELSKADRALAVAYGRALALSTDPAAMREAERRFIQRRDAAPAEEAGLLGLYRDRIAELGR